MKNKRTKLTALALSVLMAVSTISSVTWAADLFSDGSDETEVVVEEPTDNVIDVEDEVVADNAALTGLAITDITEVEFKIVNNEVHVLFKGTDAVSGKTDAVLKEIPAEHDEIIPETCMLPAYTRYYGSLELEGVSQKLTVASTQKGNQVVIGKDSNNGDHKANVTFNSNVTEVQTGTGYIVVPGSKAKSYDDGEIKGHVVQKDANNNPVMTYLTYESATCLELGIKIGYYKCKYCGAVISAADADGAGGKSVVPLYDKIEPNATQIVDYFKKTYGLSPLDSDKDGFIEDYTCDADNDGKNDLTSTTIARNAHNYDGVAVQVLSATNFVYKLNDKTCYYGEKDKNFWDYVANGEAVSVSEYSDFGTVGNPSNTKLESTYWLENKTTQEESEKALLEYAPINCNGDQIINPENGRDAYYFTYKICKNCGRAVHIEDKEYVKDTDGHKVGDFYEEVHKGNILGFLAKYVSGMPKPSELDGDQSYGLSANQKAYYLDITTPGGISTEDPRLVQPLTPILDECSKNGYYYIRKYVSDTPEPVSTEKVEIKWQEHTHTWGTIEVAPSGSIKIEGVTAVPIDGKATETEDGKLLTLYLEKRFDDINKNVKFSSDVSNGIIVTRDGNGNVIEAKSANCKTTAKYVLYHKCLRCSAVQKVEVKTADYNTDRHKWGPWSDPDTDDADNKYYDLGDGTHRVYTYYHRECELCGKRGLKPADEYEEAHKLEEKEVKDGPKEEPTCGKAGFTTVQLQCPCGYKDSESIKKSSIPPTDQHDFTGNDVELIPHGTVQIGKDGGFISKESPYNVYAEVVRKCNVCEEYDSNGINGITKGQVGCDPDLIIDTKVEGRTVEITREAKKDSNGIPYSCSEGEATITFNWAGKVDGKDTVKLEPVTVVVPYYPNETAYASRTDHKPVTRTETVKEATTTQEGSAIEITECSVCKEELSRKEIPIAKLGSAPSVKATAVNYNTVTVTWDAVEGAESYKVFNKSNALGISKWQLVATVNGTSYTDTGLVTGAKYRYTVKAVVDGHGGEYSKTGAVVSPKLTAPEIKSVTSVGSNKNKVTWTKVDGASGYIVQRKTADGNWTRIATVRGGSNINCRDKKAVAGASYRVRAFRTVEKPNFVKSNVYGPFSTAK